MVSTLTLTGPGAPGWAFAAVLVALGAAVWAALAAVSFRRRTHQLQQTRQALECRLAESARTQERLVEAERQRCAILDRITDAFCAFDRDWRFTYVNRAGEALFAQSRERLIGTVFWDQYPHIIGTVFEDRGREAMERGVAVHFELQSPRTGRWYEVAMYPSAEGLSVYGREITFRKTAEEELRESEARFRAIADSAPVMIWICSPDRRPTYFNRRWTDFTGRPLEVELERWIESVHPEDKPRKEEVLARAFATRTPFTLQFRLRRADGEYRWVQETGVPRFTPAGMFVGFAGSAVDITDLVEAEARRLEAEHRFRESLEGLELIAVMLDEQGHIVFCNDFLLYLTGWRREEVLGRNWYDVFLAAPGPAEEARRPPREAVQITSIPPHYENTIQTRWGERKLISWSNTHLHDRTGAVTGVTSLGIDITRQRWAEEQLLRHKEQLEQLVAERTAALEATNDQLRLSERLASIGTLAAGLGHDMHNLLLPVRIHLSALAASELPATVRDQVDAIEQSVEYLQQLTNGLRLLAMDVRQEQGTLTQLGAWWEQVRPMLRAAVRKEIELDARIADDLPPVRIAPGGLTQAVLNLFSNAADAIRDGGTITFWARPSDDRKHILVGVTDTGEGMPPEVVRRALEPFYTTKPRGTGTGLGLSLVHSVVRAAQGAVEIDSTPGRGTTITLRLPVAAPVRAGSPPKAVVSVADDRIASFTANFLTTMGFEVQRAGPDPNEAALWVTDASPQSLLAAKRFMDANTRRRVVVLDGDMQDWALIGAVVIDTVQRPEALRRVLRDAASLWRETGNGEHPSNPGAVR